MRSILITVSAIIIIVGAITVGFLTGFIAVDGEWIYVGPIGSNGAETSTAWESWLPGRYL